MCDNKYVITLNRDELIASLVEQNFQLRKEVADYSQMIQRVKNILYCIGGPLNDNVKRYSKNQLVTFFKIADELGLI